MKLKKEILILLFVLISVMLVFGAAKDVRDSFDSPTAVVGYVVNDPTSLTTQEQYLDNWLDLSGCTVNLIDTLYMDSTTYDGINNWSSLDVAIIAWGTSDASIDTSLANGIGEVAVLILEPAFADSFGFADTSGTVSIDTVVIRDISGFLTEPWGSADSVGVKTTGTTISKLKPPTYASNAVMLNDALNDTIVVYDTLNTQYRMAAPFSNDLALLEFNPSTYANSELRGYEYLFDRFISIAARTSEDSLFEIVAVNATNWIVTGVNPGIVSFLRMNGHTVSICDTSDGHATDFIYGETTIDWDNVELVYIGDNACHVSQLAWGDTIKIKLIPMIGFDNLFIRFLGWEGSTTALSSDSIRIDNVDARVTKNYTLNDTIAFYSSDANINVVQFNSDAVHLASLEWEGAYGHWKAWLISFNKKELFLGLEATQNVWTTDAWSALDSSLYWLLSPFPLQASDVTLTALNTDSVEISWTDNANNEDGYSVYVHNPDSAYYSHLAADVTKDTIFYIWPPNAKVTADVAVVSATDTIFSLTGKQTVYTDAVIPEPPRIWNKSDTEQYYSIGGYEFEDVFSDSNYTSNPTWTSVAGTWDVDNPDNWLEAVATNDTMSIAYDHDVDLFRDAYISFDFQMADSTYLNLQTARFYLNSNTSDFTGTGYFVEIDSTALTFEKFTGASETVLITYTWERDFDWHTILLQYNWTQSPQDTSVIWTMSYDGTSTGTSTDETYLPATGTHLGMTASNAGIHFDNFWIYGVTPGANAVNTPFALNESNSGKFVDYDTGTLEAGTTWGYYSDFGNFSGGTLTGLTKATSYIFRLKAKSGRTK